MTTKPTHNITKERANDLLKDGRPLIDVYVNGELKIEDEENWDKEVVFENCIVENFSAIGQQFEKPIRLTNCHFKNCQFTFVYFFGGLTIDNCTFDNYLDFQAGGHNKTGNQVILTNNVFKDFVNFFDCWYENEVTISNLSSILNLDSEFRFKSNSQGEFARNSRLFRVNSTKDITFKMNSFSIFHQ